MIIFMDLNKRKEKSKAKAKLERLEKLYEMVLDHRKFEIENFNKRSGFILVLQGTIFVAYAAALKDFSYAEREIVASAISSVGIFISLAQTAMTSGAKYWQNRWECEASLIEMEIHNTIEAHGDLLELDCRDYLGIFYRSYDDSDRPNAKDFKKILDSNRNLKIYTSKLVKASLVNSDDYKSDQQYADSNSNKSEWPKKISSFLIWVGRWPEKISSFLIMMKFSVSRWPIYTGLFLLVVWAAALAFSIMGPNTKPDLDTHSTSIHISKS